MNNLMPCGLEDSRVRYEPEPDEPESLLTEVEQEIEWICDDWGDAIKNDTYDDWRDVRQMIYGATQMLNQVGRHYETRAALSHLSLMAFENSLDCIKAGKYEGAPK